MSALFAVLGLVIRPITSLPEGSLGDIRLRLDADRSTYYLGEPVRLTLKVRNEGDEGVWGGFGLTWGTAEADVLYRVVGGRFAPLVERRAADRTPDGTYIDAISLPMILRPDEERTMDATLGLVPETGRFLLDHPGKYELKLVCRPRLRVLPALVMETNVVRFTIEAPPAAAEAAFADYQRDGLLLLAQAPLAAQYYDPQVIRKATEFLARHRHSVYAQHVRKGLLELLRLRRGTAETSATERQLYDDLRSADPEQD
jgi:hypothetical protein